MNEAEFNETCGVGESVIQSPCQRFVGRSTIIRLGFSITPVQLDAFVNEYIQSNSVSGWTSLGAVIGGVKNIPSLRWASPLEIKNAVEHVFTQVFGAKEAAKPKVKVGDTNHVLCRVKIS